MLPHLTVKQQSTCITHISIHTQSDTHMCTHTQRYRHTHRHTDTQTHRHTHTQTHTHTHTHTHTQIYLVTDAGQTSTNHARVFLLGTLYDALCCMKPMISTQRSHTKIPMLDNVLTQCIIFIAVMG